MSFSNNVLHHGVRIHNKVQASCELWLLVCTEQNLSRDPLV